MYRSRLDEPRTALWACIGITLVALVAAVFGVLVDRAGGVYSVQDFSRYPKESTDSSPTECVSISRTGSSEPKVSPEVCGTPASMYRVIHRAGRQARCSDDTDAQFTPKDSQIPLALCLDYDWDNTNCIDLGLDYPAKIKCSGMKNVVRPEMIVFGATDVTYCKGKGIHHSVRRFTVCLTEKPF